MKKLDRINANLNTAKLTTLSHYENSDFIRDANRYIKAIKENRIICSIGSVSKSGMSRTIKFMAPERNKALGGYQYLNYFAFMKALGFSEANKHDHYFRIGGCGMDMVFHTNYTIIHQLKSLGFISKKQCDTLSQNTPPVI